MSFLRYALPTLPRRCITTLSLPTPGLRQDGTKYAGVHTVTLLPGDGIGPEMANAVKKVFRAMKVPVEWDEHNNVGKDTGENMKAVVQSIKRNKVALKGILSAPQKGGPSLNVAMRKDLDIYASIAFIKNIPGVKSRHANIDFVIIRENTEGEYSGLEHQSYPGVVESLKVVTKFKTERIAKFAFDFAVKNGRKKVTCVHKANIMKLGDGLFLNTSKAVAGTYTGVGFNDMIVDNTAMQLVSKPQQFDVLVMPNLYGNITSNIGAGLVGGPGVVPGVNIGRDFAIFEPGCRHVGADLAGQGVANPTSLLLCSVLMLRHLGLEDHATRIAQAVYKVLSAGEIRTQDLGGSSSTDEFTDAVIKAL